MVQKNFFQAVTTRWSSSPIKGKVHGTRKIVSVKNGKGFQINENLNLTGEIMRRKKRAIKGKTIKRRRNTRGN